MITMFPKSSALRSFIAQHRELDSLISLIETSPSGYWLVGGCLRNFLLDLPQTDIDIACSTDPTSLAKRWATEVGGRWFWLDSERNQSRVLLPSGLEIDFNPLKASTIEKDLQLRDFTVNSLALSFDHTFPESQFLDPLSGLNHLRERILQMCSPESFSADPLRILKGIRHVVSLDFEFESNTWEQLCASVPLLSDIAGERIRDELAKTLASDHVAKGVKLLHESGILQILFGSAGDGWSIERGVDQIAELNLLLQQYPENDLLPFDLSEQFSVREIILFAKLISFYSPVNLPELLHNRLRFSRQLQRVTEQLQQDPPPGFFSTADKVADKRMQALLVEKLEPFSAIKMFYWGVCSEQFNFSRFRVLSTSFSVLQKFGRIPDLLNGKQVSAALGDVSPKQIGAWQEKLKVAEINGEISSPQDAEKWLKKKLLFDKQEV